MQNFLPFPNFAESARSLDRARLGKQRIESQTTMRALTGQIAWGTNQPIVLMWTGHEGALLAYIFEVCREWTERGYRDETFDRCWKMFRDWRSENGGSHVFRDPPWLGDPEYHAGHRTSLMRKMPEHYVPQFETITPITEPFWPVTKTRPMSTWIRADERIMA